jgi:hypothetical protein
MGAGLDIQTPSLKRLYQDWDRKRGQREFPARADFDPLDLKYILGNLSLVDVLQDPLRFRYRIHATNVAERIGDELTGKEVLALPHADHRNLALEHFMQVIEQRVPSVHLRHHEQVDQRVWNYEVLVLPLSSDGKTIDMLMSALTWH